MPRPRDATAQAQPDDTLTAAERAAVAADVIARFGLPAGGAAGMRTWLDLPEVPSTGATYDLTTPAYDFPPTPLRRTLLIAGTYRSGTTMVSEALATAGGCAVPLEYFQAGARRTRFQRWDGAADTYLSRVIAARTDPSGTFAAKLFWPDLAEVAGRDVTPSTALSSLANAFPVPTWVWVRRRDVVAQAVSALRALHSGRWRVMTDEAADASSVPDDPEALYRLVGMFACHDACWEEAFAGQAQAPITVWHEDLVADDQQTLRGLLADLRHRGFATAQEPTLPRLRRQASAQSAARAAAMTTAVRTRIPTRRD